VSFIENAPITLLNSTIKYIRDIQVGDFIISNPLPDEITHIFKREITDKEEIIQVRICKSQPILATGDQIVRRLPREKLETGWNPGGKKAIPFIIRNKSAELYEQDLDDCYIKDLRVGDYLVVRPYRDTYYPESLNIKEITKLDLQEKGSTLFKKVRGTSPAVVSKIEIPIDNDFLWLLGMYIAEGCIQRGRSGCSNGVIFTINIEEISLAKKISEIVQEKFGHICTSIDYPETSAKKVYINNQIIATLILNLCGELCETKVISDYIYKTPRSLLWLIGGWIDGDGGLDKRSRSRTLPGTTINQSLIRQISTILWSERLSHGIIADSSGRHKTAYRLRLTGACAQQLASYTNQYNNYAEFIPTYEDGIWVDDCYCLRIMSLVRKYGVTGNLYDLATKNYNYYQTNGIVVRSKEN